MPQLGGPPKPKKNPAPKKPPVQVAPNTEAGLVAQAKTTKKNIALQGEANAPTPSAKKNAGAGSQPGVKNYGENAPKPSAAKNAGAGSNPNIDTTAKGGPRPVAGGKTSGAGYASGPKKSATSRTSQRLATYSRGGSTFGRVGSRDGGSRVGGGFGGADRVGGAGGHAVGGLPETDDPRRDIAGDRPGGGFPGIDGAVGAGVRPGPAYFDTEGGGAGGAGGQTGGAVNPLASSISSAFTNASLEDILHGQKKKGRAKRSRRTE